METLKSKKELVRLLVTRWLGGHSGLIETTYQWVPSDGPILSLLSAPLNRPAFRVVTTHVSHGREGSPHVRKVLAGRCCANCIPDEMPCRASGFARLPCVSGNDVGES